MSYQSLYRKWRPGAFGDVLGQEHVTETLTNALREDRVGHAYLFAGPRGTGKTSSARLLAKALNCERGVSAEPCRECVSCREIAEGTSSLDVFEMDAASHTSVEDVREIRERIPFAAVSGGRKVYIIDEAHQLSTQAFNALLKMLEEPPGHVVFVLCTTESHKLPATVVSRCQRFEFRRLAPGTLEAHLANVAKAEDIEIDPDACRAIARHAHGSARDALSILDQSAAMAEGRVTAQGVVEMLGETPEDVLLELGEAIGAGDVLAAFRVVGRMVERGWDPRQLLRQLLEHLRALFLARRGAEDLLEIDDDHRAKVAEQAQRFTAAHLEWAVHVLGEAQADVRWSSHPRLTLEVAVARAARLESDATSALRARVERLERVLLAGGAPARASTPEAPARRAPRPREEPAAPRSSVPAPPPPEVQREAVVEEPVAAVRRDGSLEGVWAGLLETIKRESRVTYTHLEKGSPLELTEDALVVGFEAKQRFHAEEIAKRPEQMARVVSALRSAFGRKLRFEARTVDARAAAAEDTPPGDPVGLVVGALGGEIVEEVF